MKTSLVITVLCFIQCLAMAQTPQGQGIQFFSGTYAELLQAAKQQHKMIFIDVYTDWCGPCKAMDKNIFPLKEVGDKYNPLLLSYKLNAEKGEGIALAKKFNIGAYPSFLYLNSSGYLIHKVVGEGPAATFNGHVDKAVELAADKNQLGNLEAAFNEGNRQPAFLRTYISRKAALAIDNSQAFDEWMKVMPPEDLKKEEHLVFIGQQINGIQTSAFIFLMDHYDGLSDASKAAIKPRLYNQISEEAIPNAIRDKRLLEMKQLLRYVQQLGTLTEQQSIRMNRLNLIYAGMVKDEALLKKSGYTMVGNLMTISLDSVHAEDARRYERLSASFLKTEKDSAKLAAFEEEKPYIINVFSREVYFRLFAAASAFSTTLESRDKSLEDALTWAVRAQQLIPGVKETSDLIAKLKSNIAAGSN
ncbi:thioredoxin family protein [Chitinophaga sp.]|uniref:thioredoxin family protein n=1 Tax=Chitinophaga sp. TaxID=1869181 RepID=UPI002F95BE9D